MSVKTAAKVGNVTQNLLQTLFIALVLFVGGMVVGCLRLYCWLSPRGHQWVTSGDNDMRTPSILNRCQRCGKRRDTA
jgi:hypothetical protein